MNRESSSIQEGGVRAVPKVEALDLDSSSRPECPKRTEVRAFIVVYCPSHMH